MRKHRWRELQKEKGQVYNCTPIIFRFGDIPSQAYSAERVHTYRTQQTSQRQEMDLLAVQMANTSCIESKKKNMTRREMEAPMGRKRACVESNVWAWLAPLLGVLDSEAGDCRGKLEKKVRTGRDGCETDAQV